MKPSKANVISYICQLCCIVITVIICFGIFHWEDNNDKACFALTLGAVAFLFLCFYNIIFKGNRKGMVVGVLSGLAVIAFANRLYDYEKLKTLLPLLNNVDPLIFTIIALGGVLAILIVAKLLIYVYDNAEDKVSPTSSSSMATSNKVGGAEGNNIPLVEREGRNTDHSNARMVLYFIFLIILMGAGCALFSILYRNNVLKQNYDFFEVVTSLAKYAGSVGMILLAVFIVIIFLIEMTRLVISRMRAFFLSIKEDAKENTIPLYTVSAILDIIVCYLGYKFTGITIDSFYSFVNSGEYLVLPLLVIFFGIAFVIFLRLTHATLLLLVEMKPENVKGFLKKVNDKTKITERVIEIVRMLIDIVLNSVITVLKFVTFIPDFFETLYSLVLEDEGEFQLELEDENGVEDRSSLDSVSNQSDKGV